MMETQSAKRQPLNETPFSIEVERRAEAAVVRLAGSCTMTASDRLAQSLVSLATERPKLIVVDLGRLDFIESTGLGAIVAGFLRCRRHEGEVRLVGPAPEIAHLLEVTRLNQLFRVHPSVDEAIRST
jgi:anti-sigma B factor antagonist